MPRMSTEQRSAFKKLIRELKSTANRLQEETVHATNLVGLRTFAGSLFRISKDIRDKIESLDLREKAKPSK